MTPKISVVVPSYNKVKYIGKTLESIAKQNYPNLEVIIQDGGSTDGTTEIIHEFAKKYPKIIQYESKKDKGQLDAINKGLKKATGQILTYINADDAYTSGALNDVAKTYMAHPEALWFAGKGIVIDSKGRQIAKPVTWYKNVFLSLNLKSLLLIINYLMQPSVFITRSAYEKYGPFSGTSDFVTEYDLWLRLSNYRMPIVINKTLSKFRIEGNTKTSIMPKDLLHEDEKIARKYTNNIAILLLHKLNNILRLFVSSIL